jgi:hypothetical protein
MFLHLYIYIYIYYRYIKTRAYSPATLCPNCNAIGEQLSEITILCTDCAQTDSYIFIYIDGVCLYRWSGSLVHSIFRMWLSPPNTFWTMTAHLRTCKPATYVLDQNEAECFRCCTPHKPSSQYTYWRDTGVKLCVYAKLSRLKSENTQCEVRQIACVLLAEAAEGYLSSSQTSFL